MDKVDCIVLWWGNLVIWKGRSEKLKWSEVINWKKLWQYIIETLNDRRDKINNIVYIWDNLSDKIDWKITYAPPSPWKWFIRSLKIWNDTLKTINNTRSEIILVICWDIPLVWVNEIDFMLENIPNKEEYLTLFWINNNTLQSAYPNFNNEKRFLELEESNFIFWNAFLVRNTELEEWINRAVEVDNNWIQAKKLAQSLFSFKFKDIIVSLRLLIYSNIKFLDWKIPNILKKIKKPKQIDIKNLIENTIWKKWVKIISNSPPELVVDYDRNHQLPFFTKELQ